MPRLARWFFDAIRRPVPPDEQTVAAVGRTLADGLASAREQWPGLTLDEEASVRHVGACLHDSADPVAELAGLFLADLYLARACVDRLPGALAAFEKVYRPRVARGLRRLKADADMEEDVWQTLCTHLFVGGPTGQPRIATYRGRSPLKHFVVICSQRLGLNHERARRVRHRLEDRLALEPIASERGPELSLVRHKYRAPFEAALREAIAQLPARDRTLLHLRMIGHVSTTRLATMSRVSPATISRRLAVIRDTIWVAVIARLSRELGLVTEEVESLTRDMASQIDVAMSTALRADPAKKSRR